MRHANPRAVTVLLSANPDMSKATAAMLREADEILMKPVRPVALVELIRKRLDGEQTVRAQTVEPIATVLERERTAIAVEWVKKMAEAGAFAGSGLTTAEQTVYLTEALTEIFYRLRYPQALGRMTLFSMASLQHGARRRRQGLGSPVLVAEARALQAALFETIERNVERIDQGQLPGTLEAIADEVNAQLLQSLAGYENEKPAPFTQG
jgi:hypothetical protein